MLDLPCGNVAKVVHQEYSPKDSSPFLGFDPDGWWFQKCHPADQGLLAILFGIVLHAQLQLLDSPCHGSHNRPSGRPSTASNLCTS